MVYFIGGRAVLGLYSAGVGQIAIERGTFREIRALPQPSCSVVKCNLFGAPNNVRHKFAKALIELSESTGIRFGGYIMRRENNYVEVMIVIRPCKEEDLGNLYRLLYQFNVIDESFDFQETNYSEVSRLNRCFAVLDKETSLTTSQIILKM